jgi:hypothetical protein
LFEKTVDLRFRSEHFMTHYNDAFYWIRTYSLKLRSP